MDTPSIINVADARAHARPCRAITIEFDPEDERWPDTGMNIQIMQPGQPNRGYRVQADFLVLPGECIAIVEGEERPLRLHRPAGTEHVFVVAGDRPRAALMIGSRRLGRARYPVNEVAAKYGAPVLTATGDPEEAYADWRREPRSAVGNSWPPA